MQLGILKKESVSQNAPQKKPSVTISPNLIREKQMFDNAGNQIDPRTKQIIKPASKE